MIRKVREYVARPVEPDDADAHDGAGARAAIAAFAADVAVLDAPQPEPSLDVDTACEPVELEAKR